MYNWLIKYTDFDGNEREEEFRFNLSKAEILEMESSANTGYAQMLRNIVASRDNAKLMAAFKELLFKAYGEKTLDGRGFTKSEALSKAFSETGAYEIAFVELTTNAKKAAEFVNGIMPKEVLAAVSAQNADTSIKSS